VKVGFLFTEYLGMGPDETHVECEVFLEGFLDLVISANDLNDISASNGNIPFAIMRLFRICLKHFVAAYTSWTKTRSSNYT